MRKYTRDEIYRYTVNTIAGYTKEKLPHTFYSAADVQVKLIELSESIYRQLIREVDYLQRPGDKSEE